MLRKVILYNFVCFKDEVSFKFNENGVYFFIGGNITGKTSVFEAIRNCLKTTDLKQASSPCDPTHDSFAVCYFRTDIYQIASIYIKESGRNEISKILMATDEDGRNMQVYVARRIQNDWEIFQKKLDGIKKRENTILLKKRIKKVFVKLEKDLEVKFFDLHDVIFSEIKNCKIETPLFDEFIEKNISIQVTLPHRGINPVQSIYAEANPVQASSDSTDALRWYLERAGGGDRQKILDAIRKLSKGDTYSPNMNENSAIEIEISVTGKMAPLLRLPEAVVEGCLTSTLLCGVTPSVLCLEEPNRGMDRQATKLLCDILKQVDPQRKLVIIATHDPYFMSPWNLSKSYIFCEKGDECRVFSGNDLLTKRSGQINEKVKRSITSYPMNLIWFSRRVFFVEGPSVLMFVEAIRDVILEGSNDIGRGLLQRAGLTADHFLRQLREFLWSLTIISLGGVGEKKKAETVCDFLEMKGNRGQPVSRYYILNRYNYKEINKSLNLHLETENPLFTELAERGVFIWSDNLEIEVALFCHSENLKDLLTDNRVPVTNAEPFQIKRIQVKEEQEERSGKLFLESPLITEVNIHNIVSGILSAIQFGRGEREKDWEGGTVPMFLKFIIIAMLESNGQGDKLKWHGEDFRASVENIKPATHNT